MKTLKIRPDAPGLLYLDDEQENLCCILPASAQTVEDLQKRDARAKELVRRWNSQPELLEACKESQKAISLLCECNPNVEIAIGSGLQLKKAEEAVKAAIASAEP